MRSDIALNNPNNPNLESGIKNLGIERQDEINLQGEINLESEKLFFIRSSFDNLELRITKLESKGKCNTYD